MEPKKPSSKKFSLKKFWNRLRPNRKKDSGRGTSGVARLSNSLFGRFQHAALKGETSRVKVSPSCSRIVRSYRTDGDVADIHEIDKDRIRTCCEEALENPPEFPSREEVKERLENAHKYYGIKCVYNRYDDSDDPNDKELQPSWYYILERPLVEQYVLMNNYIRKLSVMASLKKEQSGGEEQAIEEEVSSISSCSDCSDFAPDSKIAAKLREMKKLRRSSPPSRVELMEMKSTTKSEERTVKTNEYTIIIREPAQVEDERDEEKNLPSGSQAIEFREKCQGQVDAGETELSDRRCSGDHLPDMRDFDLSHNLVDGPVEIKTGIRRPSYYHWRGNSTPTKTPLLNMDCQPPVRPRAPGTARDFLSFRGLSLSSEFVDSCRDFSVAYSEECRSACLKELAGPEDSDDDLGSTTSVIQREHSSDIPVLSLGREDLTKSRCASVVANSISERAALASDYNRECEGRGVECVGRLSEEESAGTSPVVADHVSAELDDDLLRASVSQMDNNPDLTESESTTSVETKIPAVPTKFQ